MIIKINNRCFITLAGKDRKSFLQSICTININNINDKFGGWGAVLSPQGKFQYGFFIFEYQNILYLETTNNNLMNFGTLLSKYALSCEVEFSIEQNISVYADTTPTNKCATINTTHNKLILNDPRDRAIGSRIYVFDNTKIAQTASTNDYEEIRIKNTIVDLEQEGLFNASYVLELNMDKLNGISFEKGCFVGQEVTARMHYRNATKKNIYTVESDNQLNIGDKVINANNKEIGIITSTVNNIGLAFLRNQFINDELFVNDNKINITSK